MTGEELKQFKDLLILNRLCCGSLIKVHQVFREGRSAGDILDAMRTQNLWAKKEMLRKIESDFHPDEELDQCEKNGITLIPYGSEDYPVLLREISDPPLLLYVKGKILPEDQFAVAVVGSRHASFYGETQTKQISAALAEAGVTVISGLARGIDSAAHEAALHTKTGRTLAVMGCGLNVIYPKENARLYEKIQERGAVISEYALGTPPAGLYFPRRNRIISGLSLGVLVVEAHTRSGSLITAREAMEQGREVFAVPGAVDQLTSRGTNQLIKQGAALVENAHDILEALQPVMRPLWNRMKSSFLPVSSGDERTGRSDEKKKASELRTDAAHHPEKEELLLTEALGTKGLFYDELLQRLPLSAGKLAAVLLSLELRGKIHKSRDGRFAPAPCHSR